MPYPGGTIANLEVLALGENNMTALSTAVASGAMANLKKLSLHGNQIGDSGMVALAGAMGSLASLQTLHVR